MNGRIRLVVFTLDEQRYALHLDAVQKVLPAVEITPLPKAPPIVLGVINVRGSIVPVVNTRRRFRLPERTIEPKDQFILARTPRHAIALLVDAVRGVIESPSQQIVIAQSIAPSLEYVQGIVKLEDGLILIHNLDRFLSLEEESELHEAMKEQGSRKDDARGS